MKVKDLLANKPAGVITVSPDQTLHAASQILAEHNIGALVAVDAQQKPVGILSERDIVRAISETGTDALNQPVSTAMTSNIIIAVATDKLASLANTMTEKHIRHLPIMQDDTIIGMISIGDVLKAQRDSWAVTARDLERYITGERA